VEFVKTMALICRPGTGLIMLVLALMISGCEWQRTDTGIVERFDPTPHLHKRLFRIDPTSSALNIHVYRGGTLSRLGHNHIIAAHNIRGSVWLGSTLEDSAFHLVLPAADLQVDPEILRKQGGAEFASQPTATDISGTRTNMLGAQVLDAAQYPDIEVWSNGITGSPPTPTAALTILVRGHAAKIFLPSHIEINNSVITAKGKARMQQTTLGLKPFSILMGAIAVRDEFDIYYTLTAHAEAANPP
jgi:hypothetical protein